MSVKTFYYDLKVYVLMKLHLEQKGWIMFDDSHQDLFRSKPYNDQPEVWVRNYFDLGMNIGSDMSKAISDFECAYKTAKRELRGYQ